jgi:HSP20 family protein
MDQEEEPVSDTRWNPWNDVSAFQDRINQLFDDSFPAAAPADDSSLQGKWNPVVDVFDTEDAIVVHAELPGLTKEEISVEVKGSVLILKGEKCECVYIDSDSYHQQERCFGVFQRSFSLPAEVDFSRIQATFINGVLELNIPKPEVQKTIRVAVD